LLSRPLDFFASDRRPPTPTLFPYTTLFRSRHAGGQRKRGTNARSLALPIGAHTPERSHPDSQSRGPARCRELEVSAKLSDDLDSPDPPEAPSELISRD